MNAKYLLQLMCLDMDSGADSKTLLLKEVTKGDLVQFLRLESIAD